MAETFASSVPGHNLPVGEEGEKDFKERKRFPQELFLPGFPTRDNPHPGTEDS